MGSGQKRPVIMDGYKRFDSIRQAAEYIKEHEPTPASVNAITTNIWKSLDFRNHVAYGHYFQDDVFKGMTPKEYESIIDKQREAIKKQREALERQHRLILFSRRNCVALNRHAVETSRKLLDECGVKV